ncbi:MAG: ParB/RepB/Spo0J family partition protein, partial [Oscillospiraceae bacterium]|nr:ParB/RepB/Spo0J family partition protein [Oscillospiraceae bacterium]
MKENKRPGQQLKGLSVQDLLGVTNEESAMEIELRLIHPFKDHPFKVVDDDKMQDLVDSIKQNGVLSPVLLRETERGQYEMISGHRRMHAARLAGLETIPAIIREMSDDEATIIMVD